MEHHFHVKIIIMDKILLKFVFNFVQSALLPTKLMSSNYALISALLIQVWLIGMEILQQASEYV